MVVQPDMIGLLVVQSPDDDKPAPDDYDMTVRKMTFEARGRVRVKESVSRRS